MTLRRSCIIPPSCLALLVLSAPAQPLEVPTPEVIAARDVLLADYGLVDPLAAGLRQRITQATGPTRTRLAEQLSRLYAKMLTEATSAERRKQVEDFCRELVKIAPEADSFALRLTIATAQYLPIEELVERRAMMMSSPEDDAEAERVLRIVRPVFESLATSLNTRVRQLREKKDRGVADDNDAELIRIDLEEATSLRSRAYYYGGWCNYYHALLTGDKRGASAAMDSFGGILNAVAGRPATVDRLPDGNLRYEHVAKAVLGCALASSMLGNDVEAERWLDVIERSPDVPPGVAAQMLRRQITVFAATDRWADIKAAVTRSRQPERGRATAPLNTADARILAVLALRALARTDLRPGLRLAAEDMAQAALGDLVGRGEAGHVLDLVNAFGTAPIGKDGFINNYVRGLRAYDAAREAHRKSGGDTEAPSAEPALIVAYHAAADLFAATAAATDAGQFAPERSRALVCRGLSLYFAGDLDRAADAFESAFAESSTEEQRRDALWYAVVTLDTAMSKGKPSVAERRDRLATLYVKTFPHSDRAVELLLQRIRVGGRADRREVDALLRVAPDSPMYLAARRVACRMLYKEFQRATPEEREFAILRFAEVAEDLLKAEFAKAMTDREKPAREAAEDALIHARQMADALLTSASPDVARAEAALATMDGIASYHGIDLRPHEAEMAYNRWRIAWARRDETAAQAALDQVRAAGGPYAAAADRTMYRAAADAWAQSPGDQSLARRVVAAGSRVMLDAASHEDVRATVRERVADAAFAVWLSERDAAMRDTAVRTDRTQLEKGRRTPTSLRRLAIALESLDQISEALGFWNELVGGLDETRPEWFEARHESIRLLAKSAPADAALALRQHKLLHPEWGPPPWDVKFADLEREIGPPPETAGPQSLSPGRGGAP